jgi:hypothetical protein
MAWTVPNNYIPAILLDIFPVTVALNTPGSPPTSYPDVRAIVTSSPDPRVFLFGDTAVGPDAVLVVEPDLAGFYGNPSRGFHIALASPAPVGSSLQLTFTGSCGCGSQLKRLVPFSTMRHAAVSLPQTAEEAAAVFGARHP